MVTKCLLCSQYIKLFTEVLGIVQAGNKRFSLVGKVLEETIKQFEMKVTQLLWIAVFFGMKGTLNLGRYNQYSRNFVLHIHFNSFRITSFTEPTS